MGKIENNEFIFIANVVTISQNIDKEEAIAALILSFEMNLV